MFWHWFASDPALALALLVASFSVLAASRMAESDAGIDFYQNLWVAPQAIREGSYANIYSQADRAAIGRRWLARAMRPGTSERLKRAAWFTYQGNQDVLITASPMLFTAVRPFATGDYDADYARYLSFCLACTVVSIVFLCRSLRYSYPATFLAAGLLVYWFEPFRSDLRVGNVNQVQLGFLALYLFLQSRRAWPFRGACAGLVLGLAVMFKPNLLFVALALIVSWAIHRRFGKLLRNGIGMIVGVGVALATSCSFFGDWRIWSKWLQTLPKVLNSPHTIQEGNVGLARLTFEQSGIDAAPFFAALFGALFVLALWFGRRRGTAPHSPENDARAYQQDVLAVGMGCCVAVLSARLAWLHYFILLTPLALFVFRPAANGASHVAGRVLRRVLAMVAVTLLAIAPIGALLPAAQESFGIAWQTCVGALVLFAIGLWELVKLSGPLIGKSAPLAEPTTTSSPW